jgi:hypothetical protein
LSKKLTKIRRRFADAEVEDVLDVPEPEDDGKRFPGAGPEGRKTTKICTAVLNNKPVDIPGGKTKKQAWAWCAENMKGKPFLSRLSKVATDKCLKPNGLPMSRTACRKAILATEGKTAVGFKLKLDKVVSTGAALVTKTVKGRELIPQTRGPAKKPCRASSSGEIRDCHYELEFLTPEQAAEKKLPGPGAYMRVCSAGGKPGKMFPVSGPEEAKLITDRHCCLQKGGDEKSCKPLPPSVGFGRTGTNRFGLFGYKKARR